MEANSTEIRNILKKLNFPLAKEDLVQQAKKHGVSGEVIQVLESLPDREYTNAADVNKEFHCRFRLWG